MFDAADFLYNSREHYSFMLEDASLPHHLCSCLKSKLSAFFRRYVLQPAAEYLRTYAAVISDLFQCSEERVEVDHAFSRHKPLIILDLIRRQFWRVGRLHVDDPVLSRSQYVFDGCACMIPVPGVEHKT